MTSRGSVGEPADRLRDRTADVPDWSVADLVRAKAGRTVSVVLPTRDHADVIDEAIRAIAARRGDLVDEIVVVDTGSADATVSRALASGTRVETCSPRDGHLPAGRGEAIWRALEVTSGDVLVVVDPRLDTAVSDLVGPLLLDPRLSLVKGFRRMADSDVSTHDHGGGRLTELLIRPLLAALWPDAAGVIAPLGREFAATRSALGSIPIAPGPSADIGILIDVLGIHGVDALAQVATGIAGRQDRALSELGPIGRQIVATLMDRFGVVDSGAPLISYRATASGFEARQAHPTLRDLPPVHAMTPAPVRS